MSEQATQTPDPTYNIVSILYHSLQGAEVYDQYVADAERAGDQELAGFFRRVQERDREVADDAKGILKSHL